MLAVLFTLGLIHLLHAQSTCPPGCCTQPCCEKVCKVNKESGSLGNKASTQTSKNADNQVILAVKNDKKVFRREKKAETKKVKI